MAYLVGASLALAALLFTHFAGLDRDRALYPMLLIIVASYYELFAAMGGPVSAFPSEAAGLVLFAAVAVMAFKQSLWFAVAGLVAHGIFDALHPHLIVNQGVPEWWPAFCMSFDVTAAAVLAADLFFCAKIAPSRRVALNLD